MCKCNGGPVKHLLSYQRRDFEKEGARDGRGCCVFVRRVGHDCNSHDSMTDSRNLPISFLSEPRGYLMPAYLVSDRAC
jgi:hypothetical protein